MVRKTPQLGIKREPPNAPVFATYMCFKKSSYDLAQSQAAAERARKGCAWEPQRKPLSAEDSLRPAATPQHARSAFEKTETDLAEMLPSALPPNTIRPARLSLCNCCHALLVIISDADRALM